jgi:hypothetical protein
MYALNDYPIEAIKLEMREMGLKNKIWLIRLGQKVMFCDSK